MFICGSQKRVAVKFKLLSIIISGPNLYKVENSLKFLYLYLLQEIRAKYFFNENQLKFNVNFLFKVFLMHIYRSFNSNSSTVSMLSQRVRI